MSDTLSMPPGSIVIPFAHPTHWLASLLYLVPVFVLAGGIIWQRKQDAARRAGQQDSGDDPAPEKPTE